MLGFDWVIPSWPSPAGRASSVPCSITTRRVWIDCTNVSPTRPAVRCSQVAADFRTGRSFDASEALAYRLVDEVAGASGPIRSISSPRRHPVNGKRPDSKGPLGFQPGRAPRNP